MLQNYSNVWYKGVADRGKRGLNKEFNPTIVHKAVSRCSLEHCWPILACRKKSGCAVAMVATFKERPHYYHMRSILARSFDTMAVFEQTKL